MKVVWYDAVQRDIPKEYLKSIPRNISGKNLLAINTTYGKVIQLKDVVIIIQEESTEDDSECTIIPKEWIISIK